MADLADLSTVTGTRLTEAQILGIIAQIDLDIHNLTRDGKLSCLNSGIGIANRGTGRWTNRTEAIRGLLEAKNTFEKQIAAMPAIEISVADNSNP